MPDSINYDTAFARSGGDEYDFTVIVIVGRVDERIDGAEQADQQLEHDALSHARTVAVNGASLFLSNCSISGCSASEDGGGMLVAAATGVAILADSILSDNQAVRDGGCISLRGGSLTMEDSELRRCATLQDGGGMVIQAGATPLLRRATVEACEVRTVRRG